MNILLLTFGIVGIFVIIIFLIFYQAPTQVFYTSKNNKLTPELNKLMNLLGGDISALLPRMEKTKAREQFYKIDKLLRESNNPWEITPNEFFILRFVLMGLGLILGLIFGAFIVLMAELPFFVAILVCVAFATLGWLYPGSYYEGIAKKRRSQFIKNFPEAIDYLTMALSGGGYTLGRAFGEVIRYIPDGVVREEFIRIDTELKSGRTMEATLNSFAERAPTEGIRAFSHALNNANRLSVPVVDMLRAQSRETRKELVNEIEKRIVRLPTRVMLVLTPCSTISLILIALAPSLLTIASALSDGGSII